MKRLVIIFSVSVMMFGCTVIKDRVPVGRYAEPAIVVSGHPKPYSVNGVTYYPLPSEDGFVQEGLASWYGKPFHGRRTSSGEVYNMHELTAAHKTLPLGTYVKVENLSNQREVVVKINDRGPFVKQRVIDLSRGAAGKIGLIGPGVMRVRVVALSREIGRIGSGDTYRPLVEAKNFREGRFTIQVGAFQDMKNAKRLKERLRVIFDYVSITTYMPSKEITLYRVRVSLAKSLAETKRTIKKLQYLGFSDSFVVAL